MHPCFVSFHFLSFAIQVFNVGGAARLLAKWEVLQLPCNPSPGDMEVLESAPLTRGVFAGGSLVSKGITSCLNTVQF